MDKEKKRREGEESEKVRTMIKVARNACTGNTTVSKWVIMMLLHRRSRISQ